MLCNNVRGKEITELPPPRNAVELAQRTAEDTSAFLKETNEKYQISDKASELADKTKQGFMSFYR